jgi:hypothetical protein
MSSTVAYNFFTPYSSHDDHDALLERAGLTVEKLSKAVGQASAFLKRFGEISYSTAADSHLPPIKPTASEQKFIRQNGGVPEAVVAKLGSNSIAKRKPVGEQREMFLLHVRKQHEVKQPLLFRLGTGPVKNVHLYGDNQTPDLAEYMMLANLARIMTTVSSLYPYGVKVEMVPDDKRGGTANLWPAEYGRRYVAGLRELTERLNFSHWLQIEDGQERLYQHYNVPAFHAAAEEHLRRQQKVDPVGFAAMLEVAAKKASDNLVTTSLTQPATQAEAADSAWRYLIALKAEDMSGIFAPHDAFPLRYGNHPNSFQIYTMGEGHTKLPWQIALPHELIRHDAKTDTHFPEANRSATLRSIFAATVPAMRL